MSEDEPSVPRSALPARRRVMRGFSWAVGGSMIGIAASFASNAVLTRVARPSVVGAYLLGFSIVAVMSTVARMGLNTASMRFAAEASAVADASLCRGVIVRSRRLSAATGVAIGLALAAGVSTLLGNWFDSPLLGDAAIMIGAWAFLESVRPVIGDSFRAIGDVKWAVLCNQSGRPLLSVALFAGVGLVTPDAGIRAVTLAAAAASGATVIAAYIVQAKMLRLLPRPRLPPRHLLLVTGWPLMGTQIALSVVSQGDLWIVGATKSVEQVALYGTALQAARLMVIPLLVVNIIVAPAVARLNAKGRAHEMEALLRASATLSGYPAAGVLASLALYSTSILSLAYGTFYADASSVLLILGLGQVTSVLMGSNGAALSMTGHQRVVLTTTIIVGACTLVLELVAAQLSTITAIAIASSGGTMANNLALTLLAKRRLGVWTNAAFLPSRLLEVTRWVRQKL